MTKRRSAVFASISDLFAPQRAGQILLPPVVDTADAAPYAGARDTAALRPARLRERRGAREARHGDRRLRLRAQRQGARCTATRGDPAA